MNCLRLGVVVGVLGFWGPALCRAQWTVTILHSPEMNHSEVLAVTPDRQAGSAFVTGDNLLQPIVWSGGAQSWSNLAPLPQWGGSIRGMTSSQQVGAAGQAGGAALWNGTPESLVSLHTPGAWASQANATSGDEQVGFVIPNIAGYDRATLWRGTADSAVTLHPAGAQFSSANGVAGGRQAGAAFYSDVGYRAVMWSGTAESMVSMHPAGARQSAINGMVVGQQAGWVGLVGVGHHAAIWSGTAESFVDIHPQGAGVSELLATCGVAQAGWANTAQFGITAGVWFGNAQSFVALGGLLPSNYGLSQATSIAEANGVVYVGGWAENTLTGRREAVLWTGAVPAPGAAVVLVFAGAVGGGRRRSRGAGGL